MRARWVDVLSTMGESMKDFSTFRVPLGGILHMEGTHRMSGRWIATKIAILEEPWDRQYRILVQYPDGRPPLSFPSDEEIDVVNMTRFGFYDPVNNRAISFHMPADEEEDEEAND